MITGFLGVGCLPVPAPAPWGVEDIDPLPVVLLTPSGLGELLPVPELVFRPFTGVVVVLFRGCCVLFLELLPMAVALLTET